MSGILSIIRADLVASVKNEGFMAKLKCVLASHTFHMVLFYRIGCEMARIPILGNGIRVLIEYIIRIIYASDLSLKSKIGPGLVIVHGHDIVIGGDVKIGKNCKILNSVTLGNKDTESSVNQQPTVGNNVVIGSGAKLLGLIHVGDNVVIGANSVVLKSFPSNVVVACIPARIIYSKHLKSKLP